MKRENFYRRDPGLALAGMQGMSLEERGVYNTVLDLLYLTWRPIEDNPAYIAAHCACAVQKLNPILRRLIEAGKLVRFVEDGRSYISNPHFEEERHAVKGEAKSRSGRAKVGEKSAGVGEKSDEVGHKSALLEDENVEKRPLTPLDREEKTREPPNPPGGVSDEVFEAIWKAYPQAGRQTCAKALGRQVINEAADQGCDPAQMLAAAQAISGSDYAISGGKPKRFDRWVTLRLFLNYDWQATTAPTSWQGPAEAVEIMDRAFGPGKGRAYLDAYCGWVPDQTIICVNAAMFRMIEAKASQAVTAAGMSLEFRQERAA